MLDFIVMQTEAKLTVKRAVRHLRIPRDRNRRFPFQPRSQEGHSSAETQTVGNLLSYSAHHICSQLNNELHWRQ